MLVFNSQMHLLTFIFIVLEFGMLVFYQLPHYLSYPKDQSRLYYLVLLLLLLLYNITGGLFPDPDIPIPVKIQNITAYGTGFMIASYFPYFFYKTLQLDQLRFHARYGVPLFLVLPYIIFFAGFYFFTEDLQATIKWGMIVPFIYSIIILWAILRAIRLKFRQDDQSGLGVSQREALSVYCAVLPWVCMTAFAYFQISQWIEVLFTNLGFVFITLVFMHHNIKRQKLSFQKLEELLQEEPQALHFETNLSSYPFSSREIQIIRLLHQGRSKSEISGKLFIAHSTVSRHLQNIYQKAGAKNRIDLMRRLENSSRQ